MNKFHKALSVHAMRTVVSACIAETTHISMIEFFCLLVAKKDNTGSVHYNSRPSAIFRANGSDGRRVYF